jgi:protease IV
VLFVFAVFLGIAILLAGAVGSSGRVQEKHFAHNPRAADKVAILHLEGVIVEGQGSIERQIEHASKDENVRAVVLRVNSPGGTINGSDYIYHHLTKLAEEKKIPIVVSMGGLAASGGYYVAMAVGSRSDTLYAEPTTWTGSIGVIIPHYDVSGLMQDYGVRQDSVVSRPLKGIGTMTRPMTPEEHGILQTLVNESFTQFKQVIRHGRPKFDEYPKALDVLATGQVYSAEQALRSGLIDKIGYLEDAVERAIVLSGLSPDEVNVVEYGREFSPLEYLLESRAKAPAVDLAALLDAAVPRAYYLCSWLPPLAQGPVPPWWFPR